MLLLRSMDVSATQSSPVIASAMFTTPPAGVPVPTATEASDQLTASPFEQRVQDALQRNAVSAGTKPGGVSAGSVEADEPADAADSSARAVTGLQNANRGGASLSVTKTATRTSSNASSPASETGNANAQGANPSLAGVATPQLSLAMAALLPTTRDPQAAALAEGSQPNIATQGAAGAISTAGVPTTPWSPSGAVNIGFEDESTSNVAAVTVPAGDVATPDVTSPLQPQALSAVGPSASIDDESRGSGNAPTAAPADAAAVAPVEPVQVPSASVWSPPTSISRRTASVPAGTTPDTAAPDSRVSQGGTPTDAFRTTSDFSKTRSSAEEASAGSADGWTQRPDKATAAQIASFAATVDVRFEVAVSPAVASAPFEQLASQSTMGDIAASTQNVQPATVAPGPSEGARSAPTGTPQLSLPAAQVPVRASSAAELLSVATGETATIAPGASLPARVNAASPKRPVLTTASDVAKRSAALRDASLSFSIQQAEPAQAERRPVSTAAASPDDADDISGDSQATPHTGPAEASDTSDGASLSSNSTGSADTLFTHACAQFALPAATANLQGQSSAAPIATAHVVTPSDSSAKAAPPPPTAPPASSMPLPPDPDGAQTHFVGSAKLVQAASHSEMRIAMDTDKLGPVELRARVVGDEIDAAITVEKRDAHAALAVELPALQQALSEKQLRVDQVTLLHGSLHSTSGDAGAASRQQEQRQTSSAPAAPWSPSGTASRNIGYGVSYGLESTTIFDSQGRLSVHA